MTKSAVRAFSYVRFSSGRQKEGISLQRQTDRAKDLAARHGWNLDKSLRIADLGRSGFKGSKQSGLKAFLSAIESGEVKKGDVLIIERLDRLSRKDLDTACDLCISILRKGIILATCSPEKIYDESMINDLGTRIEIMVTFSLAHQESKKKSDHAYKVWDYQRKSVKEGTGILKSSPPGWLDIKKDGRNRELKRNEVKCKIVERIFKMSADGLGHKQIIKTLNKEGIPSFTAGKRTNSVATWSDTYVKILLRNPAVYGRYQPEAFDENGKRYKKGDPIDGYYPPAIDEKLFYSVQDMIKSRAGKRGPIATQVINLFQSIVYDARTKDRMLLQKSSPTDKKAGCLRRLCSWHRGVKPSWRYEDFEDAFFDYVKELSGDKLLLNHQAIDNTTALEAKKDDLDERLAAAQKVVGSSKDFTAILSQMAFWEQERKAVIEELKAERTKNRGSKAEQIKDVISFSEAIKNAKEKDRIQIRTKARAAIHRLVKEIWVHIATKKEVGDEGNASILTAQIRFHDDTSRAFMLTRMREGVFMVGTEDGNLTNPKLDLRTFNGDHRQVWRDALTDIKKGPSITVGRKYQEVTI